MKNKGFGYDNIFELFVDSFPLISQKQLIRALLILFVFEEHCALFIEEQTCFLGRGVFVSDV